MSVADLPVHLQMMVGLFIYLAPSPFLYCCFQISCLVRRLEANPSLIYNLIQVVKFIQKQRSFLPLYAELRDDPTLHRKLSR